MTIVAADFSEYLSLIPEDRRDAFARLRAVINEHLGDGFEEGMLYNMPSWFVPFENYPKGYHCDPKIPLYYTSIASQKNSINWYANFAGDESLKEWFVTEFARTGHRLDMGKSCVRFKKLEQIPFDLIGQVVAKTPMEKWVAHYEANVRP